MDHDYKLLLRAAAKIHQGLVRRRRSPEWWLPTDAWGEVVKLAGQIELARKRGWERAAASQSENLAWAAETCKSRLTDLASQVRRSAACHPLATIPDIFRDLLALRDEFEEVSCDHEDHHLWATTAPIALEGIYLGRFEIRLDWTKLGQSPAYRVVALDPNPSSQRETVTHPHVSDEHLCEGDGQVTIRAALDQGRIGDFFLIVLNTLRTYSQGSAYEELDDWDGSPCSSCDSTTSDDSRHFCHACDTTLCGECTVSCDSCCERFCGECISSCHQCKRDCCSSCLEACQECDALVCPNCLEEELCETCFNKRKLAEETDEVTSQPTTAPAPADARAAVQSHRVGQAVVSARPRDERGRWVRRRAA